MSSPSRTRTADIGRHRSLEDQTNTTIEVDATVTGSARDSDFGILCRGIDSDNQVLLLISADGYAVIGKFTGR